MVIFIRSATIISLFLFVLSPFLYSQDSTFYLGGTTILCIVRNDTAWLGADSKVSTEGSDSNIKIDCKIGEIGNIAFALGGINDLIQYKDGKRSVFSIANLLKYCISNGRTIDKSLEIFNQEIIPILKDQGRIAIRNKNYKPGTWIRELNIEPYLITYQKGKIYLTVVSYNTKVKDQQSVTVDVIPKTHVGEIKKDSYVAAGGEIAAITNLLNKSASGDIAKNIESLINIEIKSVPQHVGPPVNIIRITKDGIKWIKKNQPCM